MQKRLISTVLLYQGICLTKNSKKGIYRKILAYLVATVSVTIKIEYKHQIECMTLKVSWHFHVNVRIWI